MDPQSRPDNKTIAPPPTFAEKDIHFYLRQIRGDFSTLEEVQTAKLGGPASQKNIVIVLGSQIVGEGREELGRTLMRHFLQALVIHRIKPKAIVLLNSAVLLASQEGEPAHKLLQLEEQGIKVLVDAASADAYGVEDELKAGSIADMDQIADHLLNAWKVISL